MQKINFKLSLIIGNILLVVTLILALILDNNRIYSLYWIIIPVVMFLLLMLMRKYDKQGLNIDKVKSKAIIRNYNDMTAVATTFYFLIYLMIMFYEIFDESIKHNSYLIICFFIITLLYEFTLITSINDAKKETIKLLNKQK